MDDYYPFGLTFNSFQRENSVEQRWKFQGQEHIDDLGLNWDSFKWRNHQPDIGRFFNIDPLAEKYIYNSPYAFSENKVVSHVELEGLEAIDIHTRQDDEALMNGQISKDEHRERQVARGNGALGAASLFLPGPEDIVIAGFAGSKIGGAILRGITKLFSKGGDEVAKKADDVVEIVIDGNKHPESATHLDDAINSGKSNEGVIDRAGSEARRKENLRNVETKPGLDRDEAPPAVVNTGEKASVRHINPSDNRGAGALIGKQIENLPDGTPVRVVPTNIPKKQ